MWMVVVSNCRDYRLAPFNLTQKTSAFILSQYFSATTSANDASDGFQLHQAGAVVREDQAQLAPSFSSLRKPNVQPYSGKMSG